MSAWPSRSWTTRRSAPWLSRCVAKAWRSVWGESDLPGGAAPRDEHVIAGPFLEYRGPAFLQIAREPGEGLLTQRHETLLRALAENAHHAHVEAHFGELQANELRDAQPARVEHLQHRPVAKPERRLRVRLHEQRLDVGLRERLGKARRFLRRIELERRIDLDAPRAREELVEALQARV